MHTLLLWSNVAYGMITSALIKISKRSQTLIINLATISEGLSCHTCLPEEAELPAPEAKAPSLYFYNMSIFRKHVLLIYGRQKLMKNCASFTEKNVFMKKLCHVFK